ncbi:MAG: hypothetical protein R3B72_49885 [Polyangiaceae bacterium]
MAKREAANRRDSVWRARGQRCGFTVAWYRGSCARDMDCGPGASTLLGAAMTTKPFSDDLIDTLASALGAVHQVMAGPGLCLPQCYLLRRVLAAHHPGHPFTLCLGALRVDPLDRGQPILFDPRTDAGVDIDAGFHAWLEDEQGRMVDPSILVTLVAEGYAVDPTHIVLAGNQQFGNFGLRFT